MQRPYYGNGPYDPGTDAVLTWGGWGGWGGNVPSWGRGRGANAQVSAPTANARQLDVTTSAISRAVRRPGGE